MLERFKVPKADTVRVPESSLRETVAAIFEKMGVTGGDSAIGADVLVTADLRGVETHGVSNMLRAYVKLYGDGSMNPRPDWKIVRESPATATIDADDGLALILGPKAMRIAIDKARRVGIGAVTMYNAGHSGPIGHHAMLAVQEDMIGIVMTAASAKIVPTFAAEARYGTNPIAIAAPARNEAPFLFDAATSTIAGNKLRLAERVEATLLPHWIADRDGVPNAEETLVPADYEEFSLLPLGGTREHGSHKGYGFAMMAEIMATLLSGALPSMLDSKSGSHHHFAAYSIEAFTDVDEFKDTMDRTLHKLRTTRPATGHDRVLYPGLSEHEDEQERRANGIPLHREVVEWFDDTTAELSLQTLQRM
jgi:LDH2 family malate/lactate/ureidoglycolate dehydrogenase